VRFNPYLWPEGGGGLHLCPVTPLSVVLGGISHGSHPALCPTLLSLNHVQSVYIEQQSNCADYQSEYCTGLQWTGGAQTWSCLAAFSSLLGLLESPRKLE